MSWSHIFELGEHKLELKMAFFFFSAWWNGRCASVKVKVRFVRAVLETVRRCTGMHICTALWLHLIRIKESCTHWTGEWIRWHIVTRAICYYGDVAGSTCSFLSFRHNFNLNFIWDFWLLTYFPEDHHSGWVHTFDLAQILCWVLSLTHLYSANSQQQSPSRRFILLYKDSTIFKPMDPRMQRTW